jgi:hypothetical protein
VGEMEEETPSQKKSKTSDEQINDSIKKFQMETKFTETPQKSNSELFSFQIAQQQMYFERQKQILEQQQMYKAFLLKQKLEEERIKQEEDFKKLQYSKLQENNCALPSFKEFLENVSQMKNNHS